jgi:IS4 transposase
LLEIIAGAVVALIALFTSYDHITIAGRFLPLQQQWGIGFIAASLALVVVDAQLATRSRLREADERARERDRANQERSRAAQERIRADQERSRADQLLASIDALSLPDASSSTQAPPTATNIAPCSP